MNRLWLFLFMTFAVQLSIAIQDSQAIYVGFNHILLFDEQGSVTAYDYRRQLLPSSTCDRIPQPPLLDQVKLEDWISKSQNNEGHKSLKYTHLGFENFLIEDKDTGAWVARRCRDFRPQLSTLPCEVFATGTSNLLASPYKTIYIGNSRVMILDTVTGEFQIHPFDADVHSGGDPFSFSSGALLTGFIPIPHDDLQSTDFTVLHILNYGDILVAFQRITKVIQGFSFDSKTKKGSVMFFTPVFATQAKQHNQMTGVGENQIMFFDGKLNFQVWEIALNGSNVRPRSLFHGNFVHGHNCFHDNATVCVMTDGCAWCPATKSCHSYDMVLGNYCDNHKCEEPTIFNDIPAAIEEEKLPFCEEGEEPKLVDQITIGKPQLLLPGNVRLSDEYRDGKGDPTFEQSAPIIPLLDNELGDDSPNISINETYTIIHENNRVAQGIVYRPPVPKTISPCMNTGGTSQTDNTNAFAGSNSMNSASNPVITYTSPTGDSDKNETVNCLRLPQKGSPIQKNDDNFVPAQGVETTRKEIFIPTEQRHHDQQDIMNHPRLTNTLFVSSENFNPKNPAKTENIDLYYPATLQPIYHPSLEYLMNQNENRYGLVGDVTKTSDDTGVNLDFNSAMMKTARPVMPKSIDQQLTLFKTERSFTENDPMPAELPEAH